MKFQVSGKVIFNKKINQHIYNLKIHAPKIAKSAKPGQFVHIRCSGLNTPLLRRPMGIFNVDKDSFEIMYHLRGIGTHTLAEKTKGDIIDVLGPLGNGFGIDRKFFAILIGGGTGMFPLHFLSRNLLTNKIPFRVLMGARTKDDLATLKFFKSIIKDKKTIVTATDDGSCGCKGSICDLLESEIEQALLRSEKVKIYSCGPTPMLRIVKLIAGIHNTTCDLSLEEYMGCGVGACLSCVCLSTDEKYKRVCIEGPVFNSEEVVI